MKKNVIITDERLLKGIANHFGGRESDFLAHCKRFMDALKTGRLVSSEKSTGVGRWKIKIIELSFDKSAKMFTTLNFNALFMAFGFKVSYNCEIYTTGGNTDIIFSTTTYIIDRLYHCGIITKKEYNDLWGKKTNKI